MNSDNQVVMTNGASVACPVKPISVKVVGWWVLIVSSLVAIISLCLFVRDLMAGRTLCFVAAWGAFCGFLGPSAILLSVGLNVRRGDNSARIVGAIVALCFMGMGFRECFSDGVGFSFFGLFLCILVTGTTLALLFSHSANAWFRNMKEYRKSTHQVLHFSCWKCLIYILLAFALVSVVSCCVEPIVRSAAHSARSDAQSPKRQDAMFKEIQEAEYAFVKAIAGGEDKTVAIKIFTEIFDSYGVQEEDVEAQKFLKYYLTFADFYVEFRDACAEWNRTWEDRVNKLAEENSEFYVWNHGSKADSVLDELLKINGQFALFVDEADGQLLEMGRERGQSEEANRAFRTGFFRKIKERLQARVEYLALMRKGRNVLEDAANGQIAESDANEKLAAIGEKLTKIEEVLAVIPEKRGK